LHFYLSLFIKHPTLKLAFSVFTFGFAVGFLSFSVRSMFIVPTLKTTFGKWLSANIGESKEFWEDVVAEAKRFYKLEIERKLEILQKQQEALQRIKQNL
jgi:hypothetical protein